MKNEGSLLNVYDKKELRGSKKSLALLSNRRIKQVSEIEKRIKEAEEIIKIREEEVDLKKKENEDRKRQQEVQRRREEARKQRQAELKKQRENEKIQKEMPRHHRPGQQTTEARTRARAWSWVTTHILVCIQVLQV